MRPGALAPSHCPTMPPHRQSAPIHFADAQCIDHCEHVAAEPLHRIGSLRHARLAVTTPVVTHQPEMAAPGRHLVVPHVQIGVRDPHVPEKSTTCVGFASQKTGLGSTWEAAQRDGEAAELLLRSRAPERGNLDRHGAPDMLGLIGRQCLEAGQNRRQCIRASGWRAYPFQVPRPGHVIAATPSHCSKGESIVGVDARVRLECFFLHFPTPGTRGLVGL